MLRENDVENHGDWEGVLHTHSWYTEGCPRTPNSVMCMRAVLSPSHPPLCPIH